MPRRRPLRVWLDERGSTAIEYGLIAAFVAVAAIYIIAGLGVSLSAIFDFVASAMGLA